MHADQIPFQPGWPSFDLPGYRLRNGTYYLFPYESLPPIGGVPLNDDIAWRPPLDEGLLHAAGDERSEVATHLPQIIAEAVAHEVVLPAAFLSLMHERALQSRFPSCTACYFDLPAHLTPSPFGDGEYLIRFLNDQQWVLLWYLYLHRDGSHCVVASQALYDDLDWYWEMEYDGEPSHLDNEAARLEHLRQKTWWCAPSFETFLYRFWLENQLWYALTRDRHRTLSGAERAYLQHYHQYKEP